MDPENIVIEICDLVMAIFRGILEFLGAGLNLLVSRSLIRPE